MFVIARAILFFLSFSANAETKVSAHQVSTLIRPTQTQMADKKIQLFNANFDRGNDDAPENNVRGNISTGHLEATLFTINNEKNQPQLYLEFMALPYQHPVPNGESPQFCLSERNKWLETPEEDLNLNLTVDRIYIKGDTAELSWFR